MSRIQSIDAELFCMPLDEVLSDYMHGDNTDFELVVTQVHVNRGIMGTGCTYTGGKGESAIKATCHF